MINLYPSATQRLPLAGVGPVALIVFKRACDAHQFRVVHQRMGVLLVQ
jgi:hypothetical protein